MKKPEVKIGGSDLWEASELIIENERLKTLTKSLKNKMKEIEEELNDHDHFRKKNRGLVIMIDKLRKEIEVIKADMGVKNLQIKSKDCCIANLKSNIDKIEQDIKELKQGNDMI